MSASFTKSSASNQSHLPRSIAEFQIERELGRGGMGIVYLAEDTRLQRHVAIKVLPPELTCNTTARSQFEQEARILASLNHPHIAGVYQFLKHEGVSYLVLEYVAGQSLRERTGQRPLEANTAFNIALQMAAALANAHDKGVIHRDLKPENIQVTPDGNVKILDFGLAQLVALDQSRGSPQTALTGAERVVGTPAYMSPEQARGEPVDQRTDVWAFGCTLYTMLTGRLPFAGHSFDELVGALLTSEPDWTLIPSNVPAEVIDLIQNCLQKDHQKRQSQLHMAVEVLSKALRGDYQWEYSADATSLPHHNLPRQFSAFFGRAKELADLKRLLQQSPLVTLTGFGGAGKTRLAIEVGFQLAAEFPAGAWIVELASVNNAEIVPATVAKALNIKERPNEQIIQTLINSLKTKKVLLVLDNCEHVLTACSELCNALLQNCSTVRILATSRELLHLDCERAYPLSPLTVPDPAKIRGAKTLLTYGAVQLFVDRAAQYKRDFVITDSNAPAVATICWQLDGIPLALELAAARLRLLSVERLSERLIDRFRLLTSGNQRTMSRHRTLRALIDWSYNLLDEREERLLQRISVFPDGGTLEAVFAVCRDVLRDEIEVLQILSALVEKSLLIVDHANIETRYRMLETVRQYCVDRLVEEGDAEQVRDKLLEYFVEFAESVRSKARHLDDLAALNQFEVEHNNLRAALDWGNTNDTLVELTIRLAAVLGRFWELRGYWSEGRTRLAQAVERSSVTSHSRARALMLAGNITNQQGDFAAARAFYEKSLCHFYELNDLQSVSITLGNLANVPLEQGEYHQARQLYEEAIRLGGNFEENRNLVALKVGLAEVALAEGRYDEVLAWSEEALQMSLAIGNEKFAADSLALLGYAAVKSQNHQRAQELFDQSLALCMKLDYKPGMAISLIGLGDVFASLGYHQSALTKYQQSLQIHRDIGYEQRIALSLEALAECLAALNELDRATKLLGAAHALREKIGAPVPLRTASRRAQTISRLQKSLGQIRFQKLWTDGISVRLENTLDYALSKCDGKWSSAD